jgi:outer membrane lipoprotein carrier protein
VKAHLEKIERRYNSIRTLRVNFEETYRVGGRTGKTETGELYLRKPGKMRWDYSSPAGKLFVSDGKNVYFYTPRGNRAEKVGLKDTDDMRAPLAFLLGKLEFEREFQNFRLATHSSGVTTLTVDPKSDRLPYKQVEFTFDNLYQITRLNVTGHDNSVLTFVFTNERLNPAMDDKLFRFELPPGATFAEPAASASASGNAK